MEVCSPRISHLLSLCCDAFTKEQLCNLECLILLRLNFRLAAPTLAFFMDYYTNCMEAAQNQAGGGFARRTLDTKRPRRCSNLALKVCELSLADYAFNKYPASLTASCALRLASELLGTEQGLTTQSGEDQWDSFVDEPWDGHNHNLARECKDNLKMLVSLNQEKLDGMSNMWRQWASQMFAKCQNSSLTLGGVVFFRLFQENTEVRMKCLMFKCWDDHVHSTSVILDTSHWMFYNLALLFTIYW